jgi:hypothetical protein
MRICAIEIRKKYHGNQLQHFLHNTVYCTN